MTDKALLRKTSKEVRDKINCPDGAERLKNNFLFNIKLQPNSVVAVYYPISSEISVLPLAKELVQWGHRICLPCITGVDQPLIFREWKMGAELSFENRIPEPPKFAEQLTPNVIIVPMLAFDGNKFRLGYGGGYYDRTLASTSALKIGVAYADQEVFVIPREEHDIPLDFIVTEIGTLVSSHK